MAALLFIATKAQMNQETIAALRDWKKQWAAVNPSNSGMNFYDVRHQDKDSAEEQISDNQLAFAWIYGDVVHADEGRRSRGRVFGIEERFRAAVPLIVRLVLMSGYILSVVRDMAAAGAIPGIDDVLEEEVVVTRTVIESEGRVYVADHAPDGSFPEPGSTSEELSPEWLPLAQALPGLIAEEDSGEGWRRRARGLGR